MTAKRKAQIATGVLYAACVAFTAAIYGRVPHPVAGIAVTTLLVFLLLWLERVFPHRGAWSRSDGQVWNDLVHAVIGSGLGLMIGAALVVRIASRLSVGLWPFAAPVWVQGLLVFVIADLGHYVQHRLFHRVPLLWRFHMLHHEAERLTVLKALRFHLFERVVQQVAMFGPLAVIGAPFDLVLVYLVPNMFLGFFTHSNVDVDFGILEYVVMGPASHRIHHSREATESHSNFGNCIVPLDMIFGTWKSPFRAPGPRVLGIEGHAVQESALSQMLDPFSRDAARLARPIDRTLNDVE